MTDQTEKESHDLSMALVCLGRGGQASDLAHLTASESFASPLPTCDGHHLPENAI